MWPHDGMTIGECLIMCSKQTRHVIISAVFESASWRSSGSFGSSHRLNGKFWCFAFCLSIFGVVWGVWVFLMCCD